jgi:peptide/nickel transport system ATP-binding protein
MKIANLTAGYGSFIAVREVSLDIPPGSVVGLVGESGSGKSTLAKALVGLATIRSGQVEGVHPHARQLIFQDPYSSLNPRLSIGESVAEGCRVPRAKRAEEAGRLLGLVSLDPALAGRYPRDLSGGQRQRVAIARALGAKPELLIADEITSALDVSVQGTVLNLIKSLRDQLGLTVLFISHNLAVVRYVADSIAVMRDGRLVEAGPTEQVTTEPSADYTKDLLASVPNLGERLRP